jgi:hypothetical protein
MIVLKRNSKTKPLLVATFDFRIADPAIDGSERDDAVNLHPHFQGPTKETFIEA